eukprot:CAMPEP_0172519528 /NCGR_PEP_ID=MMETSP1066-20121228/291468_1 /TAXON_ID=671091 /ORGANISM="Coscinodiscus wailesii, Strain CCMP2513" /LENGTH=824 /DNA_ID=CAMNT_0013302133 /DNA_START=159 /DNA_END=2630 /DNA_ORIENTATION=-
MSEPTSSATNAVPAAYDGPKRYTIDIRVFLAAITTIMVLAFGIGVAYGPLPEFSEAANNNYPLSSSSEAPLGTLDMAGAGGDIPAGTDGGGWKQVPPKRLPTAHSADLGRKVEQTHVNFETPSLESLSGINLTGDDGSTGNGDEDEDHLPAGQHLLVDIRNIEAAFLNSEERLANAMIETVKTAGLTLLSYHCHSLIPAGVSCVGVLLESHISFHTWPEEGVITLDLFTCGSNPLIPVVSVLEKLFGIPRAKQGGNCTESCEMEEIETFWSHELRGFRHYEDRKAHYLDLQSDLAIWITSPLDLSYKKEIVSVESAYQRIDIWDFLDVGETPNYEDAVRMGLQPGDKRWLDSKYASPERLLFLDGTLQSRSDNEREYHESLVHPAMFAHPSPERVAIIGGGEGATLREVLKHNTVKEAKMIELDEMMVNIAKQYLPKMSNCSDIVDSADSCFDDPRSQLLLEDARPYFIDRYGPSKVKESNGLFDVVVVDALDPEEDNEVSTKLYTDGDFLNSLYAALSDEGVMVIQVGTAPNIHDPRADRGVYAKREKMFNMLENHPQTAAMLVYEEAHCGFLEPHSFLVVCKHVKCRDRWYAGSDAVDFQIYERIRNTKSKQPALVHFDGSTQYTYQYPPKAWETVYCRREPTPYECAFRGLDLEADIHDLSTDDDEPSSFEVRTNEETKEIGVYAIVEIKEGDYVMASDLASSLVISNQSKDNLEHNTQIAGHGSAVVIEDLLEFIDEHGHVSLTEGLESHIVEIGASFLVRKVNDASIANVDRLRPIPAGQKRPPYSPVLDRHRHSFDVFLVATRDIHVGEEVIKYNGVW